MIHWRVDKQFQALLNAAILVCQSVVQHKLARVDDEAGGTTKRAE